MPLIFYGTREVGLLLWRVVLRALLEGIPPEELQSQFPVFKRLVSSYRAHGYNGNEALASSINLFLLKPILMRRFLTRST